MGNATFSYARARSSGGTNASRGTSATAFSTRSADIPEEASSESSRSLDGRSSVDTELNSLVCRILAQTRIHAVTEPSGGSRMHSPGPIVGWTGHRPDIFKDPREARDVVARQVQEVQRACPSAQLVCGCQRGVDSWVAEAGVNLG